MSKVACLALIASGLLAQLPVFGQEPGRDVMTDAATQLPSAAELEAVGATIGRIIIEKQNVFDTSKPGENKSIFRLANRWHIITRDSVIEQQLLFRSGDRFSQRELEESERLLRLNNYLYDTKITPISYEDGVVDIRRKSQPGRTFRAEPAGSWRKASGELCRKCRPRFDEFRVLGQESRRHLDVNTLQTLG
jgi:hypothetical protein